MSGEWTDQIAGARMQVDQQFRDRIIDSEFTNQQWGLIMSAVEFEITDAETPAKAQLVANTDKVEQILPEVDNMPRATPGQPQSSGDSSGGLLDGLFGLFSSEDDGVDQERLDTATRLAEAYATELQAFLEDQGRWESLCQQVAQSGRA
jgi:hypothetical protein